VGHFALAATYTVSGNVAEIVAATPNGRTLIYTDSASEEVGFVDISDPTLPTEITTLAVAGEPTSVAVTPSGRWALVVVHGTPDHLVVVDLSDRTIETTIPLGGQPDSIAISPNGRFAAIAIENERDEDVNDGEMPQLPAGFLTIVDLVEAPSVWTTRNVALTGIANRFSNDPEPEFVDINAANQAAVTLQENNHIVIVDLVSGSVITHWSAGSTTHVADTDDDGQIIFDDVLMNARREPDAIVWTPRGNLVTANEGDYDVDLGPGEFVGGRDFTIFSARGPVLFEPGAAVEINAAQAGLYDDSRADAKGCEIEGAEVGEYHNHAFLFLGAERCGFVAVYRLTGNEAKPKFVQTLATGSRPEGLLAIPQRALFVSANEGDGTISIFQGSPGNP
jgi:DNA-binding beta-propeller fold protein YncE